MYLKLISSVISLVFALSTSMPLNAGSFVKVNKTEKLSYEDTTSLYFELMTFSDKLSEFTFGVPIKKNEIGKGDKYVRVVKAAENVIRVEDYVNAD